MKATLTEIRPTAEYQGEIHTQDVFLKVTGGPKLRVSDPRKRCKETMVDQVIDIQLKGDNIREIEIIDYEDYKLDPHNKTPSLNILRGQIKEIIEETSDKYILNIDVGHGLLQCHIYKSDVPELSPQLHEWIECRQIRGLYIDDVNPIKQS